MLPNTLYQFALDAPYIALGVGPCSRMALACAGWGIIGCNLAQLVLHYCNASIARFDISSVCQSRGTFNNELSTENQLLKLLDKHIRA